MLTRGAEHLWPAASWQLLLSSIAVFSFDFLRSKGRCQGWRWHTGNRSFCRAVPRCAGKHEDVSWEEERSKAPEKDGYWLPSYSREVEPHTDSCAQNYAAGLRWQKHGPNKERGGANVKKHSWLWCFWGGRTQLLIRSYCLRAVNYLVVKSCYLPGDGNFSGVSSFTKAILVRIHKAFSDFKTVNFTIIIAL